MRKRPKYTPDWALEDLLFAMRNFISEKEWVTGGWSHEPHCKVCYAYKTSGHKPRCVVKSIKWNIEKELDLINS